MKDVNKVILMGRLGANPILRLTKTGIPVAQLSVATTRRFQTAETLPGAAPSYKEETQWHRVVVWRRQAESCAQYLRSGSPVYVEGSIKTSTYEDKEGKTRLSVEIQAEMVSFLGGPRSTSEKVSLEPEVELENKTETEVGKDETDVPEFREFNAIGG